MAIRRDYFKRQVEVLAQALGAAMGLKKRGEIREATSAYEDSLKLAFGLDASLALGLPLKEFLALACRGEEPSFELLTALHTTFGQWAETLALAGQGQAAGIARERAVSLAQLAEAEAGRQ